MEEVYAKIYDIVREKLDDSNVEMQCTKNIFLYTTRVNPGICNGRDIFDFDGLEFLQAAYVGLLKRLPDQYANQKWDYFIKTKTEDEFKEVLIDSLIDSAESITKGTRMQSNSVLMPKTRERGCMKQLITGEVEQVKELSKKQKVIEALYKVYLKLPIGIKRVIRKLTGRE